MTIPDGIVVVDKPAGITSHGVVSRLRRAFGIRRVGHGGTLDPGATGVLVVFVGRATRLADVLGGGTKVYDATIRFGVATDTDDAHGTAIERGSVPVLTLEELRETGRAFIGCIEQIPPAYSAVHQDGVRAYQLARKGRVPELDARCVVIEAVEPLTWRPPDLDVRVTCGGGTYIRSLARDWGRSLGTFGHIAQLRRLRSGPFSLNEARSLDEIERCVAEGSADSLVRSPFPTLIETVGHTLELDERQVQYFRHGTPLGPVTTDEGLVVVSMDETFVGLGEVRSGTLMPRFIWSPI